MAMEGNGKQEVATHVPVFLSSSEVLEKLQERCRTGVKKPYLAMYSSYYGGITTDPAMMVIPMDDHMVHRGHGVFDTALIMDGCLYELDAHLKRFFISASKAKIEPPFQIPTLRAILIQLAAVSGCRHGLLRYWLSAGSGDFELSPTSCTGSLLYAIVIDEEYSQCIKGVKVITSTIPMKSPFFATMKSVNYLPNVLSKIEAEEKGAYAGIWVDDLGNIAEGPHGNVAFINKNRELLLPSFDRILSGCTAKKLLDLAHTLVQNGQLKAIRTVDVSIMDAKRSEEMMYVGSGIPVLPIIEWDGQPIGDGQVGELTLALSNLLWEDMKSGPDRLPIPYKQSFSAARTSHSS